MPIKSKWRAAEASNAHFNRLLGFKPNFMRKLIWMLGCCCCLLVFPGFGQDTTAVSIPALAADSSQTDELDTWPSPRKALRWAIIPGGGQIYNRRWWKLPLVYGAFGGMVYAIDYNQSRFRRLRTALDLKRQDLPHEFTGTSLDDERTLLILRDEFDKNTQLSYVGIVLIYALQGIEAFTDAHLRHFDISDDLSLQVKPSFETPDIGGMPAPGLGLKLSFAPARK